MANAKPKKTSGKGGARFVLMVGDEGAILVQMQRKRVVRRLFAQSADPNHSRGIDEALNAIPKAPVTVLVDMMDQSYIRQTLPPVSSLSVGKIVKRRMDKDFSPDDIKGYLLLDRDKTGRRDWNYLMVSLANSAVLQKWIAFAVERSNPFQGIGLIPLEAQAFLRSAAKILLKSEDKNAKPLEWQILVNHHKVGGFRQIVLRGGRLVFTRMAQPIGESLPDVIAGNIEQEMINTLEYLKRMGLQDPATLSVIVVVSEEIKQSLDAKNIKSGEHHFFTPYEMANLLGIADAAQPEDHFGDVVLSAFIARQRKLLLPLHTPYTRKLSSLAMLSRGVITAALIGALATLGWAGSNGMDILTTQQSIEDLQTQHGALVRKLDDIKQKTKTLPKDIDTLADAVNMIKAFSQRRFDPLVFVDQVASTLKSAGIVTKYHWSLSTPSDTGKPGSDTRQISAEIDIRFTTPHQPVKDYIAAAQDLVERVKNAFSDYDVTNSELPGLLADTQVLKTVIGDNGVVAPTGSSAQIDSVIITIKGPLTPDQLAKKNGH